MEPWRPLPWIAALALAACGGTTTGNGGDASVDQSSDQVSVDAGGDVVGPGGPCPATPPNDGDACDAGSGFQCEYGSSFWAYCDVLATCTSTTIPNSYQWHLESSQSCPFTEGGGSCPSTLPGSGVTCTPDGITCGYPTGQCNCMGFCGGPYDPDAGVDWKCMTPDPSCPWPRPRFGTACTADAGAYCSYDICCAGSTMNCQNGYWQGSTMMGGCP
jgi:hypothetical protein